jgi:hypothetical protein
MNRGQLQLALVFLFQAWIMTIFSCQNGRLKQKMQQIIPILEMSKYWQTSTWQLSSQPIRQVVMEVCFKCFNQSARHGVNGLGLP